MGIVRRATVPVKLGDPRTRATSLDTELIRRQAAVKTKFKDTVRLAEERDGYAGRCWQLERDNDMLRKRLAELSAVAELLQQ